MHSKMPREFLGNSISRIYVPTMPAHSVYIYSLIAGGLGDCTNRTRKNPPSETVSAGFNGREASARSCFNSLIRRLFGSNSHVGRMSTQYCIFNWFRDPYSTVVCHVAVTLLDSSSGVCRATRAPRLYATPSTHRYHPLRMGRNVDEMMPLRSHLVMSPLSGVSGGGQWIIRSPKG